MQLIVKIKIWLLFSRLLNLTYTYPLVIDAKVRYAVRLGYALTFSLDAPACRSSTSALPSAQIVDIVVANGSFSQESQTQSTPIGTTGNR